MSSNPANRLMRASSAASFLRRQGGRLALPTLAALKSEVDRLAASDLNRAARLVDRLEELSQLASDPVAEAFARGGRARVLDHQGDHAQADALYQSAVSAMRAAGLATEAAILQKQQLHALIQLGRYEDALRSAHAARRVLAGSDKSDTARLQLGQLEANVGNIYYALDRYGKALRHYDRAQEILSEVGDDAMRALVNFSRSNILTETDQPVEAMKLLESAARSFRRAGRHLQAAQARFNIAYLQFKLGNYNTALAGYYRARDRLTELGSRELAALCNQDIAEIMLALNAFEDAAESAALAYTSFDELGMPYESARARLTRGLAGVGLQNYDQAGADLAGAREAFAQSRNTLMAALLDSYLAEFHLRRGNYADAASLADRALRVFARQKLPIKAAHARLIAARAAYHQGHPAKAARQARTALAATEGQFAPGLAWQLHHLTGLMERDRGQKPNALESFRRAIALIEQMRGRVVADEFKTSFLRDKVAVYEDAITACLDQGGEALIEEAFRLVESAKSRALADLLARYAHESADKAPASKTCARLLQLLGELNWYGSQASAEDEKGERRAPEVAAAYRQKLARCERQVAQLFRRLETEGGDFTRLRRLEAASAADLRGCLEADETAVEYFITGDHISAFVASRHRLAIARDIACRRDVEAQLAALRFQMEKFRYGEDYVAANFEHLRQGSDEILTRLYEMVFEPLEMMIEHHKLVIIPHGPLHYVPFTALYDGRDYLVDLFDISHAPSAAVLRLCRARAKSQISNLKSQILALGVAGPDIPNVEEEIRALGEIFPDALRLTGGQATRENLLAHAPQARFLHIASHGYFRHDNPMFSCLKLADAPLNFYNLLDLKLNVEMVTLSACQTGVNAISPGDELHGLMRGFLQAGAPSLVVSLWTVSDRSTAELMGEMYRRLRAGDTKRAALRAAQMKIKEDFSHPYYWAPFVLMGSPV